jgi:Co/Zn/Cd efflux system component
MDDCCVDKACAVAQLRERQATTLRLVLTANAGMFVDGRGPVWTARAAVAKAALMGLFGAFVFGQIVYKLLHPQVPSFEAMGVVGALALAVNGACFALLWRHRAEDINMRSVWLCSRNDLVANAGVLVAALAVWISHSPWPDVAIGALICTIFFRSAFLVAREAHLELRMNHATPVARAGAPRAARR